MVPKENIDMLYGHAKAFKSLCQAMQLMHANSTINTSTEQESFLTLLRSSFSSLSSTYNAFIDEQGSSPVNAVKNERSDNIRPVLGQHIPSRYADSTVREPSDQIGSLSTFQALQTLPQTVTRGLTTPTAANATAGPSGTSLSGKGTVRRPRDIKKPKVDNKEMREKKKLAADIKKCQEKLKKLKEKKGKKPRVRKTCNRCDACKTPDCLECLPCLDKPKYGGPGKLRRPCGKKPDCTVYNPQAQQSDSNARK